MDFKPEYVRCTWSPELEGKEVLYSDSIDELWREVVSSKDNRILCEKGMTVNYPFKCGIENFRFVYYDPNYSIKIAHEQGNKIECKRKGDAWEDWDYTPAPAWLDDHEYRIQPEEQEPVTNRELARWLAQGNGECKQSDSDMWFSTYHYYWSGEDNTPAGNLVRKWEDTEWQRPTRAYLGLD